MTDQPTLTYRIQQELKRTPSIRIDAQNRLILEALLGLLDATPIERCWRCDA